MLGVAFNICRNRANKTIQRHIERRNGRQISNLYMRSGGAAGYQYDARMHRERQTRTLSYLETVQANVMSTEAYDGHVPVESLSELI